MKKELKKRRAVYADVARDTGLSPSYVGSVLTGNILYEPKPEIKKKIIHWFETCHVCHREWPEKINLNGNGDKGE